MRRKNQMGPKASFIGGDWKVNTATQQKKSVLKIVGASQWTAKSLNVPFGSELSTHSNPVIMLVVGTIKAINKVVG